MKKIIFLAGLLIMALSSKANAQAGIDYLEEVRALGAIAGQGMACKASKYDTFEMLARAILITKASSDNMQEQGMKIYNEEKANTYVSKQFDGFYDCADTKYRFDNQDIFKVTLYSDGTIKMPDGQIFTPRHPYDVTLVYNKDKDSKKNAQKIYDKKPSVKTNNATIKVEGIDLKRTKIQQPVYSQPKSTVGKISR